MKTNSIVKIKYSTKPVFLEVESGYSTIGAFMVVAFVNGKPLELFPNRIKKVHDNIPDIFLFPFEPKELKETKILIYGKYAPAPSHKQVRIVYNFVQESVKLKIIETKSNGIEEEIDEKGKTYFNYFEFK